MNTYSRLTSAQGAQSKSLEKLSSGLRINRAGDDAAGLAISEKMRGQIGGLNQAVRNAQDGISLIQTAEGALNETHSILNRMRELAVQSANDTNTNDDRNEIQKEMDELAKEITRISNNTEFNTQKLINGGISDTKFHVGANKGQNIALKIDAMDSFSLGVAGSSVKPSVADGATNISGATISGTRGASLVDGATLSVTVAEVGAVTGVTGNIGSHSLGGVTVTTANETDAYNDYQITVADNTTEGIAIDHDAKTITISADISNTATASGSLTVSSTGTAPEGAGDLVFSGTATVAVGTAETIGTDGTAGATEVAASDASLTVNVGGQAITGVSTSATSLTISEGAHQGLTINFGTAPTATTAGTINIELTSPSKAVIAADGSVTTEAVAEAGIDVSSQSAASNAIETIDNAISLVSAERSKLGAVQNRLDHTINNLTTTSENLSAAESRIRDVDMAKEMMEFTKNNILNQASTAMLAQANQMPQGVLQLLG